MTKEEIQKIVKDNDALLNKATTEINKAIARMHEALYFIDSMRAPNKHFDDYEAMSFAYQLHEILDLFGLGTTGFRDDIGTLICLFGRDLYDDIPF